MTTANHHPRRRALLAVITVVGTLLVTAGPVGAAGTTRSHTVEPDLQQDAKIQPALRTELEKEDVADFWVLLKEKADLGAASGIADWDARGRAVVRELKQTARASQAEVAARLTAAGVEHQAFWAANAIRVTDGSLDLAHDLVAEPQVAALRVLRSYGPVEPVRRAARAAADTVEWGVANIRADQVWRDLGVDGEGIVIANIDTGVQFDHPALASQYRGYDGAGGYDHDYNWLDTSADCPTAAPCDNQGHGTHTMGTMVGSDGGANEIGVAPGATWIAANGCATCSDEDLLEAGQWMLAPTRVDGTDADPSMRPDIVNNSWGTNEPTNDPLLEEVSQAWTASGIFGVWANGNLGPGCRTSGSPGSRTINYSVGAYGPDNLIANFSSRGDGQGGDIKPDIAAPGVDVRSAFPGGGYGLGSGTSMATPHVSGAIALLWSGNPSLIGDIDATRSLLDATAIDSNDLQCGGEPGNNNVFGEGRLDALALVEVGSRGLGDLAGTVTDAVTGRPLAGVTVQATSGAATRTEMTGADGTYARQLAPGDYTVSVRLHGYVAQTSTITIERDQSVTEDFALAPAQRVVLSGRVTDGAAGWPLAASLTASDRGGDSVTAATDPVTGAYALDLLPGETYSIKVQAGVPGYAVETASVAVAESDLVRNLGMSADLLACTAPGYRSRHGAGMREAFRTPRLPRGWRVRNRDVDLPYYENGPGWRFIEPGRRQNRTGGRGGMAIVDSERAGPHHVQDTFLVTRPVDLGRARTPVVEFSSDLEPAVNSTAVVQVSTNGRTWKTVWRRGGATAEAVGSQVVAVPQLAGRREASVRFRYVGSWSRWWALDDVFIGNRTCQRSDAPPPA